MPEAERQTRATSGQMPLKALQKRLKGMLSAAHLARPSVTAPWALQCQAGQRTATRGPPPRAAPVTMPAGPAGPPIARTKPPQSGVLLTVAPWPAETAPVTMPAADAVGGP